MGQLQGPGRRNPESSAETRKMIPEISRYAFLIDLGDVWGFLVSFDESCEKLMTSHRNLRNEKEFRNSP